MDRHVRVFFVSPNMILGELKMLENCKNGGVISVDLHEYTVSDAKQKLQSTVNTAPKNTQEIIVIHGYNNGTALRDMVRKEFKNKRVVKKFLGMNQGVTILVLKSDF